MVLLSFWSSVFLILFLINKFQLFFNCAKKGCNRIKLKFGDQNEKNKNFELHKTTNMLGGFSRDMWDCFLLLPIILYLPCERTMTLY